MEPGHQPAAVQRRARFLEREGRRQRRQQRVFLERHLRHGVRDQRARRSPRTGCGVTCARKPTWSFNSSIDVGFSAAARGGEPSISAGWRCTSSDTCWASTHPDDNGQSVTAVMNSHSQQYRPPDVATTSRARGRCSDAAGSGAPGRRSSVWCVVSAPRRVARLPQPARGQIPGRASRRRPTSTSRRHRRRHRLTSGAPVHRVIAHTPAGRRPRRRRRSTASPAPARLAAKRAVAGAVQFPPRNEPLGLPNQLEAKYRDGLRRGPTST